jgi:hypothetical protein
MAEKMSVQGPVKVEPTAAEYTALKLMQHIAEYEGKDQEKGDRKYWLTLYHQCLLVVKDHDSLGLNRTEGLSPS